MSVIKMTDLDLAGKRVLIREDMNVPLKEGKVSNDARIRASLPTIEHAMNAGARVMLVSHLGRPTEGEPDPKYSMAPVADYLSGILGKPVRLITDWLEGVELEAGEVACSRTYASSRAKKRTTMNSPKRWRRCATCM